MSDPSQWLCIFTKKLDLLQAMLQKLSDPSLSRSKTHDGGVGRFPSLFILGLALTLPAGLTLGIQDVICNLESQAEKLRITADRAHLLWRRPSNPGAGPSSREDERPGFTHVDILDRR
jgi:hypothetical protein